MIEYTKLGAAIQASLDEKICVLAQANQCPATALVVQDYLGGQVVCQEISGPCVYYNTLGTETFDFTQDPVTKIKLSKHAKLITRQDLDRKELEKYFILRSRVFKYMRLTTQMKQ